MFYFHKVPMLAKDVGGLHLKNHNGQLKYSIMT